jgi:hypothetical protein
MTLTPDGKLLDGRNRAEACAIAGVEPLTVVYEGDPWAFSISRNAHRRHMLSVDQKAMIVAQLAQRGRGEYARGANPSNEGFTRTVAEAAATAGIPRTAVESAKVVLNRGTEGEKAAVRSGAVKVRKQADAIRARTSSKPHKTPKAPEDPIADIVKILARDYSDGEWRTIARVTNLLGYARPAVEQALMRLDGAERDGERFRILKDLAPFELEGSASEPAESHRGYDTEDPTAELRKALETQREEFRAALDAKGIEHAAALKAKDESIAELQARIDTLMATLDRERATVVALGTENSELRVRLDTSTRGRPKKGQQSGSSQEPKQPAESAG